MNFILQKRLLESMANPEELESEYNMIKKVVGNSKKRKRMNNVKKTASSSDDSDENKKSKKTKGKTFCLS